MGFFREFLERGGEPHGQRWEVRSAQAGMGVLGVMGAVGAVGVVGAVGWVILL